MKELHTILSCSVVRWVHIILNTWTPTNMLGYRALQLLMLAVDMHSPNYVPIKYCQLAHTPG